MQLPCNNAMYSGGVGLLNDKTSIEITRQQIMYIIEQFNEGKLNNK